MSDKLPDEAALSPQETERLQRKARLGALALGAGTVAQQLVTLGGSVLLARLLNPADYGVFGSIRGVLDFFMFFGDVGLGAALIRKRTAPSDGELSTIFWVQLALSGAIVLLVAVAAPLFPHVWPDLPRSAPWLMRALALDLLLTALRVVPVVLIERELEFWKLAVVDSLVAVSFYAVAVPLAKLDLRVWSLVCGVMAQGVVGLVAVLSLKRWRPRLLFDREALRPLLRFGLAVQARGVVGLVNGLVTPLYATTMLGVAAVGYIKWAESTAFFSITVVNIVARANFPLYARLHADPKVLGEALGRSIRLCGVVTFAFVAAFLALGPNITHVIYKDQWLPAVPLLYTYAGAVTIGFLVPVIAPAIDAMGRPDVLFKLSIGWTALNWCAVALITPFWGRAGYVNANVIHVVVGNLALVYVAKRLLPSLRVASSLAGPFAAALVTGIACRFLIAPWANGWLTLTLGIGGACLLLLAALFVFDRGAVRDGMALLRPKKPDPAAGA